MPTSKPFFYPKQLGVTFPIELGVTDIVSWLRCMSTRDLDMEPPWSGTPVGSLKWFVFTDHIPQFTCVTNPQPLPPWEDSPNLFSAWFYYEFFSNSSCTSGPQLLEMSKSKWVGSFIVLMYFHVSSGCPSQFCGYSHGTTVPAPRLLG